MSTEENKALMRRITEEFINAGNLDAADEFFAADFINYSPGPGMTPDREGLKQYVSMMRSAFPDLHIEEEDIIAEGDKVVAMGKAIGTHKGDFRGIPPTGKQITVSVISIVRIAGGKVVERWNITDQLSMMQQLGILPTPGQ